MEISEPISPRMLAQIDQIHAKIRSIADTYIDAVSEASDLFTDDEFNSYSFDIAWHVAANKYGTDMGHVAALDAQNEKFFSVFMDVITYEMVIAEIVKKMTSKR